MTTLNKTKIIQIMKFGLYLILGFTLPFVFGTFFVLFLSYKGIEYIVAIIFLIIGYFAHYQFRNIARKIGLINKRKIYWLERTLNICALFLWIVNAMTILIKYELMNS